MFKVYGVTLRASA